MYHPIIFTSLMSRQGLIDLLQAAEHSLSLRLELRNCSSHQDLLNLASQYGFSIKLCDLENENSSQRIEDWFENSKIPPIRK